MRPVSPTDKNQQALADRSRDEGGKAVLRVEIFSLRNPGKSYKRGNARASRAHAFYTRGFRASGNIPSRRTRLVATDAPRLCHNQVRLRSRIPATSSGALKREHPWGLRNAGTSAANLSVTPGPCPFATA